MARTKGVFQEWKEEQRRIGREEALIDRLIEGIFKAINEGRTEEIIEERKNILEELSKNKSPEEILSMLNKKLCEINENFGIY